MAFSISSISVCFQSIVIYVSLALYFLRNVDYSVYREEYDNEGGNE